MNLEPGAGVVNGELIQAAGFFSEFFESIEQIKHDLFSSFES